MGKMARRLHINGFGIQKGKQTPEKMQGQQAKSWMDITNPFCCQLRPERFEIPGIHQTAYILAYIPIGWEVYNTLNHNVFRFYCDYNIFQIIL